MKIKSIVVLVALALTMTMIGCNKDDNNRGDNESSVIELPVFDIEESSNKNYEVELVDFNVGSESYTSTSGKKLPYEVSGSIAVPKSEGKFPIVLVTHGSHDNEDESNEFYSGFNYLIENLAKNGYIAISMDMRMAYIWKYGDNDDNEKTRAMVEKHIESLKLANEGKDLGYNVDLTNKIDFENISLIGHSRGGKTVFDIANDQIEKGENIKSVLAIAPTTTFDREYGNYDVSILVPEYDGDVANLDGINIYETIVSKKRDNLTSLTILEKANHNYFNKNIKTNDAVMLKSEEDLKNQISREEQESFLLNFAVDFLNASLNNEIENTIYDLNKPQPNKMYGKDVKVQSINNKVNKVINTDSLDEFKGMEATIEEAQDSWFYKDDEIIIDTITSGDEDLKIRKLVNIKWNSNNARVEILPSTKDFSNNESLVFNLVIDSASELNNPNESQSFSIEVKDKNGNISKVILPKNLVALEYTEGKIEITPIFDEEIKYWTNKTPISEVRIPLTYFKNIDLKNIDTISLIFDQSNSGSIFIDSIELQ